MAKQEVIRVLIADDHHVVHVAGQSTFDREESEVVGEASDGVGGA